MVLSMVVVVVVAVAVSGVGVHIHIPCPPSHRLIHARTHHFLRLGDGVLGHGVDQHFPLPRPVLALDALRGGGLMVVVVSL